MNSEFSVDDKDILVLERLSNARLPFISFLTNPTMALVMTSFVSPEDIMIAKPGVFVELAGLLVIEETTL
jgi:acetyl-CoA carboxylase carboxyl transferase subunit beta